MDANLDTVHILFRQFPKMGFLPVENRGKFMGVIYRYEFLQTYLFQDSDYLTASDLITNNIIYLSPDNTLAEAADVFETDVFNALANSRGEDGVVESVLRMSHFKSMSNCPNSMGFIKLHGTI